MSDRYLLRIAAPMIAISLMLLLTGAVAAWNVQRQQGITSTLIAREVEGMLAAQNVYIGMREIRRQLNQFLRNRDRKHLDAIPALHEETAKQLKRAKELARTPEEQDLIGVVDRGYAHFWDEFQRIMHSKFDGDRDRALGNLIEDLLSDEVLEPGQKYIDYNRQVVLRTNEASRTTSDQMRQGFLLMGICGGAAGLVAGLAIARGISRSIVQLEVSVRSAAGKLNQVVGPVTFSRVGGLRELESGLQTMEDHIADVVERLQQTELEVLRNEQLAAVGQLAAGVAHELRNPLMPMKMLVQAALERDDGRGLVGRQLQVVEEEIERLERTIQMLLDFARPSSIEKTTFDLCGIVRQKLELVAGRAERQHVVIREVMPSTPVTITADCGQMRQVLLNLLLNALDELPDGGEIQVEVSGDNDAGSDRSADEGAADPACAPSVAAARRFGATIRIADSGPGFPPDMLERIFEPFVTTKETGTGLGLSVCRRIVEAHGGEISARNRPQRGAEFTIRLPRSSGATGSSGTGETRLVATR